MGTVEPRAGQCPPRHAKRFIHLAEQECVARTASCAKTCESFAKISAACTAAIRPAVSRRPPPPAYGSPPPPAYGSPLAGLRLAASAGLRFAASAQPVYVQPPPAGVVQAARRPAASAAGLCPAAARR